MTESASPEAIEAFLDPWLRAAGGAERANFAPFIYELIDILGVERPGQAEAGALGAYQFEGPVPEGSLAGGGAGRIDLYKRGCFVMEAKQSQLSAGEKEGPGLFEDAPYVPLTPSGARYDRLMIKAQRQAKNYAVHLPGDHPRAPFLIVCDIGRAFEIFYDFTGNGRGYGFFPDKLGYRIPLARLRDPETRALLRDIWTDPGARDPSRQTVLVTRDISTKLAEISKHIEEHKEFRDELAARGHAATEEVALFLMRLLFCMFAEDVGLLPERKFSEFLESCTRPHDEASGALMDRDQFAKGLADLWLKMGSDAAQDRWSWSLGARVRYFNGGLFESQRVFPLNRNDLDKLIAAASRDWRKVEPAIFGTLLEQALPTGERAKLGAHYTPRGYVERLVDATIMEVLNAEWDSAEDAMTTPEATAEETLRVAQGFHDRLAAVRVLDPACGTGNFLYVAMEAIERLEARVIETIESLGGEASPRVGPHQFFGLELNPRAARITELVLWIGWLRFRIENNPESVTDPVLRRLDNINFGRHGGYDAVLDQTRTGEPDLANPTASAWPEADFIVGNPPFIGGKDLRDRLGGDYTEALWKANPRVPKSADFVMQWWDRAADILTRPGTRLRRFGLVTTNSITQVFSRRVIEAWLNSSPSSLGEGDREAVEGPAAKRSESAPPGAVPGAGAPPLHHPPEEADGPPPRDKLGEELEKLHLVLAIPDHPWTRATRDAAAVRIAMTVAEAGAREGRVIAITGEHALDTDEPRLDERETIGRINADLSIGTDVTRVASLRANEGLCSPGVKLHGARFIVTPDEARDLGLGTRAGLEAHIRDYRNGRDLLQRPRGVMVIDLFGLSEEEVMDRFPEVYQHILTTVRDSVDDKGVANGRAVNARESYKRYWWIFGEPRRDLRPALAGLKRYIATTETSKHRIFQFIDGSVLADNSAIVFGTDEPFHLGILSSRLHFEWVVGLGGWLGFGNDNRYSKSLVFDPFPFPAVSEAQAAAIGVIAERLDATRRTALAENPALTMTGLYNLVAAIRDGTLAAKDEAAAVKARARIVAKLHDDLDAAVAAGYGWEWPLAPAEIVARLVALNAGRAAEEKTGKVRWLRPDYQEPRFGAR